MRRYYRHFKQATAEKSEQVVNTDHFGEKKEFLFPWELKREKKTDIRSYYRHFKKKTAEKSEQGVNTDHFGQKKEFLFPW